MAGAAGEAPGAVRASATAVTAALVLPTISDRRSIKERSNGDMEVHPRGFELVRAARIARTDVCGRARALGAPSPDEGPQLRMVVLGGWGSGESAQPLPDGSEGRVGSSQMGIGRRAPTAGRAGRLQQEAAQAPEDIHPSPLQRPFLQRSHLLHIGVADVPTIAMSVAMASVCLLASAASPAARIPCVARPSATVMASMK